MKRRRDERTRDAAISSPALSSRALPIAALRHGLSALACLAAVGLGACSSDDESPAVVAAPDSGELPDSAPPDAGPVTEPPDANVGNCKPLKYPAGMTFRSKPDPALTAEYESIAEPPNYPLPECFLDTDDLVDPVTGTTYDVDVKVGKYFTLRELVGTSLKYTKRVLLSPVLVEKLDRYREALGEAVEITSGYRSPPHQRAVCQDMCGQDYCPGTCAQRSRHSWGDAADHGVYPLRKHSDAGCAADFNYVYREGDHVHLDLNPQHEICTVDVL